MEKPVTVRLPESQVRQLMALAVVDDVNLAQLLREAVRDYVDARFRDKAELTAKAQAARVRQENVLEGLELAVVNSAARSH